MKSVNPGAYRCQLIRSAFFGALALSVGVVSMAAEPGEVRQAVVQYGDLNLANPQGAKTLYSRISAAAHEVCNPFYEDIRDLGVKKAVDACVHKAIENAVNTIGQPQLSEVFAAKARLPAPVFTASTRAR